MFSYQEKVPTARRGDLLRGVQDGLFQPLQIIHDVQCDISMHRNGTPCFVRLLGHGDERNAFQVAVKTLWHRKQKQKSESWAPHARNVREHMEVEKRPTERSDRA